MQQKKIEEEAANEILKANYVSTEKKIVEIVNKDEPSGVDVEDDLPF